MTTTISWTPQDTRSSKNVQRGKRFSNFVYRNSEEKILFNQTRNSESIVVRARTHLNYFTKCLEKNIQKKKKKKIDITSEHFTIVFATISRKV